KTPRCAPGRALSWSARTKRRSSSCRRSFAFPFGAVQQFGAPQALRHELLRVLRLHTEVVRDLLHRAAFKVSQPKNFLTAWRQTLQRLARRDLIGEAVEDAHRRRIGAIEVEVFVHRLRASVEAPV